MAEPFSNVFGGPKTQSPVPESNRTPLPYHGSALPNELTGRRAKLDLGAIASDAAPQHAGDTPASMNLSGGVSACREKDSNLRRRLPADLQSASFGRSDIPAHTETVRIKRTVWEDRILAMPRGSAQY